MLFVDTCVKAIVDAHRDMAIFVFVYNEAGILVIVVMSGGFWEISFLDDGVVIVISGLVDDFILSVLQEVSAFVAGDAICVVVVKTKPLAACRGCKPWAMETFRQGVGRHAGSARAS